MHWNRRRAGDLPHPRPIDTWLVCIFRQSSECFGPPAVLQSSLFPSFFLALHHPHLHPNAIARCSPSSPRSTVAPGMWTYGGATPLRLASPATAQLPPTPRTHLSPPLLLARPSRCTVSLVTPGQTRHACVHGCTVRMIRVGTSLRGRAGNAAHSTSGSIFTSRIDRVFCLPHT